MKLNPVLFSLISLLAIACSSTSGKEASSSEQPAAIELPSSFYKKMRGTIDNKLAISMDLSRGNTYDKSDSVMHGSYYYDKVGMPLRLHGYIRKDDTIELREFNSAYEETGIFRGRFTANGVFEGTWTNPKTNKSLPFRLSEVQENVAQVNYNNLRKENCDYAEKNKRLPKDSVISPWDTVCSYIDITWSSIQLSNAAVSKRINEQLNTLLSGNYKTVERYADSTMAVQVSDYGFLTMDVYFSVETNDNNILCISDNESTFTGGAHPSSGCIYHNFDLKTGKELELNDLFVPGYEKTLNPIAEAIFVKNHGAEDVWNFEKGKFTLNDNFMLAKGGITFLFNQYEIGPYAAGMPDVFIPYSAFKSLVKPGSPALGLWDK